MRKTGNSVLPVRDLPHNHFPHQRADAMTIAYPVKSVIAVMLLLFVCGCVRIPDGVVPVTDFEINRYLGTWYEIARLDHSFERGLSRVTAHYSLGEGGVIQVVNRGYDRQRNRWKEARGKAYFIDSTRSGRLKVSFFGPFYGGYNIIALDRERYNHALVCGPSRSYLWILSRTSTLTPDTLQALIGTAKSLGFATENLIYVEH
jgi:apolipoprotein D and lipocalin family protein